MCSGRPYRLSTSWDWIRRKTSACIGLLMELHHEGIISAKDTDGIAMERGSKDAILKTVEKIATARDTEIFWLKPDDSSKELRPRCRGKSGSGKRIGAPSL